MDSKLRIAGVPEAFNEPLRACATATLSTHTGGSGQMRASLKTGAVDAALLLTEAALSDADLHVLTPIVTSSLRWAVVVKQSNPSINSMDDLHARTWGISRYGSGSHLMPLITHAAAAPTFRECADISGLMAALEEGEIDLFIWEWFTTSPFRNQGKVKFVGFIPTPWKCFSLTVTKDTKANNPEKVQRLLAFATEFLTAAHAFKHGGDESVARVQNAYDMTTADAAEWLRLVEYCSVDSIGELTSDEVDSVKSALKVANII